MFEPRFSVSVLVFLHVRCLLYLCHMLCVTSLCPAVLTTPLSLIPFQCTNSPFFLFISTRALDMQGKIKSIFFCIKYKLLLVGVQGFVYRCVTPGMHLSWFSKCWVSLAGQSNALSWHQGCQGRAARAPLGGRSCPGACVSWGNNTRSPWEEPAPLQKPLCHLGFPGPYCSA